MLMHINKNKFVLVTIIIYETCMGTGNLRWFSVGDVLFGELSEWLVAKPVAIASNIEHECGLSLGADVGAGKADKRAGTRNWAAFDWQYRYIQTINQLLPPPRHHHCHLCCQCNHLFSPPSPSTHTHIQIDCWSPLYPALPACLRDQSFPRDQEHLRWSQASWWVLGQEHDMQSFPRNYLSQGTYMASWWVLRRVDDESSFPENSSSCACSPTSLSLLLHCDNWVMEAKRPPPLSINNGQPGSWFKNSIFF